MKKLNLAILCIVLLFISVISFANPYKLIVQKTYYPSYNDIKKLHEEYEVYSNDTNIKSGSYKLYDILGDLKIEGNYINNIRTGEWKYYTSNFTDSIVTFKSGIRDGKYISYYSFTTNKKTEGNINGNIKTSKWTYYKNDIKNSLDAEINFDEFGRRDGNCITYYANGNKNCNAYYSNGRKKGTWQVFSENGDILSTFAYINNEATLIQSGHNDFEDETNDVEIFERTEIMPSYPGSYPELMKFLSKGIIYPALARENGLEGKVIIKFYVDELGFVCNAKILKDGVGGGCGEESIRVVSNMPRWSPGMQRGKPVKVYYMLPISFKLQ